VFAATIRCLIRSLILGRSYNVTSAMDTTKPSQNRLVRDGGEETCSCIKVLTCLYLTSDFFHALFAKSCVALWILSPGDLPGLNPQYHPLNQK